MKVFAPVNLLMSVLNATGWDTDMLVPTGRAINSVDTSGTLAANVARQHRSAVVVAGTDTSNGGKAAESTHNAATYKIIYQCPIPLSFSPRSTMRVNAESKTSSGTSYVYGGWTLIPYADGTILTAASMAIQQLVILTGPLWSTTEVNYTAKTADVGMVPGAYFVLLLYQGGGLTQYIRNITIGYTYSAMDVGSIGTAWSGVI